MTVQSVNLTTQPGAIVSRGWTWADHICCFQTLDALFLKDLFSDYFANITVKFFKNVWDNHNDFVHIELFCLYILLFDWTTVQQF